MNMLSQLEQSKHELLRMVEPPYANDFYHDIWLKLLKYNKIRQLDWSIPQKPLIFKAAKDIRISRHRQRNRRSAVLTQLVSEPRLCQVLPPVYEFTALPQSHQRRLKAAISVQLFRLSERQRLAIRLRFIEEARYGVIAQRLNESEQVTRQWCHRFLSRVKRSAQIPQSHDAAGAAGSFSKNDQKCQRN